MGNPQWIKGSQYKWESSISYTEIETFLNNIQERLNAHDNRITGEGVRMEEFSYAYFGDLNDDVLK